MKEKLKKFINSKLFVFIITALVFSTIGVSAATYFASSNVTYDNTESGLTSTDVQGAIDELYGVCSSPQISGPVGDILDNINIVTSGDGLYEDEYEEGRYFYKGKNPNNYITFNNEQAGWRIISLEKDGTIKIIKNESIGEMAWNSSTYNRTLWNYPASLNTYLNNTYLSSSLNSIAQSQIVTKDWGPGGIDWTDTNLTITIHKEKTNIWNGKVALPTASEYIRSNSNQNNCGSMKQVYETSSCKNTTWMYNSTNYWLLSPTTGEYNVYCVSSDGKAIHSGAGSNQGVRPTVYISSSVKITSGDGSQSNPYTIE